MKKATKLCLTLTDAAYADQPNDEELLNTNTVRRRSRVPTGQRQSNALLRERGQSYLGVKTVVDDEGRRRRTMVPRLGRRMRARCECKSPAFQCRRVADELRRRLFDEYWALSWEQKRAFMNRLVVLGGVQRPRHRKDASLSRRSKSLKYHLEADGKRWRVCKTMFLNTFDLSSFGARGWPKKRASGGRAVEVPDCLLDESQDQSWFEFAAATGGGQPVDVPDCRLDELDDKSWFEEFTARLLEEADRGSSCQKRKSSSPSTDSSKLDGTEELISESDGENERVESTTFVDVSSGGCDFGDESSNSVAEDRSYGECETSTASRARSSPQPDIRQMLLEMSRKMDESLEKFDKRLHSVESKLSLAPELSEAAEEKNRDPLTMSSNSPASDAGSASTDDQEADSLTESQNDAENLKEESNAKAKEILSPIADHVNNCYKGWCTTCNKLRGICSSIQSTPSRQTYRFRGIRFVRRETDDPLPPFETNELQCEYCLRTYESDVQHYYHLTRHSVDPSKPCCHCTRVNNPYSIPLRIPREISGRS